MNNPVPWLRSGVGTTPQNGGCIMQVIDWIDTGGWTDKPECVHPAIRALAIRLNDSLDDQGRQRLLDLAPRMMGTNTGGKEMSVRLAVFCARGVLGIFEKQRLGDDRPRKAIEAAEKWIEAPTKENAYAADAAADAANAAADAAYAANADAYAAANAANAANAAADAANAANAAAAANATAYAAADAAYAAHAAHVATKFDLLVSLLDEYDRITERGQQQYVDWAPVCEVMVNA